MKIETMAQAKDAFEKLAEDPDKPSNEVATGAVMAAVFLIFDVAESLRCIANRTDD